MSKLDTALNQMFSLNSMKENILINILEARKTLKEYSSDMINKVIENRFSKWECCLYCEK